MFPTLNLFASIRCPEVGTCKRNPCLFSHTAPPPRVVALTSAKRSSSAASQSGDERPSKLVKKSAKPPVSLFAQSNEDAIILSPTKPSAPVASTSRGTQPAPALRAAGKPKIEILRNGQVVRKTAGIVPPRNISIPATTSLVAPSSFLKGKERAPEPVAGSTAGPLGPPRLPLTLKTTFVPVATRNTMLKNIHTEFSRVYSRLSPRGVALRLASEHALEQEASIYSKNNKFSYRTACIAILARLKKRESAHDFEDVGTMEDWDARRKESETEEKSRLTVDKALQLSMSYDLLVAHDYVTEVPPGAGGNIVTEEGGIKICDRCGTQYTVHGNLSQDELRACQHHWGRLQVQRVGQRGRMWSCCQTPLGATGCSIGPHVFSEKLPGDLHSRLAFMHTSALTAAQDARPLEIAALDCEMIHTTSGLSLARLTIIDANDLIVLDDHVVPNGMVVDLITRWSGVTESDLEQKARMDLVQLRRRKLGNYIDQNTLLIGHGLENDLKALRLVHPSDRIIDTAQLYPHPKGLPFRLSLRDLARDHLKLFIQNRGSEGHSSAADAKAALDLTKLRAAKIAEGLAVPNKFLRSSSIRS